MPSLPRFRLSLLCSLSALLALATAGVQAAPDLPGSKDHPEVKRITDSRIVWYKFNAFDELNLPLEPIDWNGGVYKDTKRQHVEGAHTVLYYSLPADVSPFEVVHQYGSELKEQHGFEEVWAPDGETPLEPKFGGEKFVTRVYPDAEANGLGYFHGFNGTGKRYGSFKGKSAKGGDLYVSVLAFLITDNSGSGFPKLQDFAKFTKGQTVARVDVVETKGMATRMSVVKAADITDSVTKTGHVAIYGVYFDTDKADLKPESKDALAEMAQAIKGAGTGKKFLIVGHTDNQGALDYNQTLSAKRAKAVTEALAKDYGLPVASIVPVGVGMAAPVAPNSDEAGRAKNRRVEIVAM